MTIEANLTNRDATVGPQPYVKWSHEPPRAQDVPGAIARAIHHASLPPRGPAFVSIPMDDWNAEADEDRAANATGRVVSGRAMPDPDALANLAARLAAASHPVLIAAPDIDASGGGTRASRWPSASACRFGRPRRPAAGGSASPRTIRTSSGCSRRRSGGCRRR